MCWEEGGAETAEGALDAVMALAGSVSSRRRKGDSGGGARGERGQWVGGSGSGSGSGVRRESRLGKGRGQAVT